METTKKQTAWFRRGWVLILGGVVGVGLILFGNQSLTSKGKEANSSEEEQVSDITMYMQATEDKIAALCARVRGVSNVTVAITLEGDFTCVYAQNVQTEEKEGGREQEE